MTNVRFTINTDTGKISVAFPYDAELVSLIKQFVPGPHRSYNAGDKSWTIGVSFYEELKRIIEFHGHAVTVGDQHPPVPEATIQSFFEPKIEDGYDAKAKAAELIEQIPAKYRGKVFRAMAHQLYPDLYRRS